jgi:hypothetical protein
MSEPEMVERSARIFRFGHYPAKGKGDAAALGWGITREEFVAANGETGTIPVGFDPIRLKHYEGKTSALDGRTGTATFSIEGEEVHAKVRMPKWLDEVRSEIGLKISSVLGRAGKELRKIDLVDTPHIPDAVFFADDHGDVVVFEDDEPESDAVEFEEDRRHLADMHHAIIGEFLPGLCDGTHDASKETPAEHGLRLVHDHAVHEGGAYCPGMGHHGEVSMSDEIEVEKVEDEAAVEFAEETPREKAMREKLERLEAQLADKDAVSFADSVTKGEGRRAYPVERASIVDGYKRAAAIDSRLNDTVTFTAEDGKTARKGSHLDAFKASILVRPKVATSPEGTVGFDLSEEPVTPKGADDKALDAFEEKARKYARQLNGSK